MIGVFTAAYATNREEGGDMYGNWVEQIFDSLPTDFSTPLTTGTVKKAHALVDENGVFSGVAGDLKWGIGDEAASTTFINSAEEGTVKMSGISPKMRISALSGASQNPEVQWENSSGHAALYFDQPSSELRVWLQKDSTTPTVGENGLVITPSQVNLPLGGSVNGHKLVTTFACAPDSDGTKTFLNGFDANGNPVCERGTKGVYDWVRNDFGSCVTEVSGCVQKRIVSCADQDGNLVAESFCHSNPYFPNPPDSIRVCDPDRCAALKYAVSVDAPTGALDGYAYNPLFGYFHMKGATYGVMLPANGASGNLSGYAYNPNLGYINFCGGTAPNNYCVHYDSTTNKLTGYAYNPIVGYINFNNTNNLYLVTLNKTLGRIVGNAYNPIMGYIRFTQE
ncbi:MAG: hypothetical protein WCJ84_00890 [Candidatus Peregrinibacteria bacterium]